MEPAALRALRVLILEVQEARLLVMEPVEEEEQEVVRLVALAVIQQQVREVLAITRVGSAERIKLLMGMGILLQQLPAAAVAVQEVFRTLRIEQEVKELQVR